MVEHGATAVAKTKPSFPTTPGVFHGRAKNSMSQDVNKHLDRARRSLEKNKLREAVAEYQAALEDSPMNPEALQALADIYTRLNEPAMAAQYYAAQFDRLIETGDAVKATALFSRYLRSYTQPPERLMRYATLLQKHQRPFEAIEQFSAAANAFHENHRDIEALACCESIALLDPDNPDRHARLGNLAEGLRHADLAARSFLRAGQLTLASGALDQALDYFGRAHQLIPEDRTCALLLAEAKLRKGDPEGAVTLLEPFSPSEKDTAFLALFGEGLLRTGRLDRAWEVFVAYYRQKPNSFSKLFDVVGAYVRLGDDGTAAAMVAEIKEWMLKVRKEADLAMQVDRLAAAYPDSLPLAEAVARTYEDLSREAKYFEALMRLFDLYYAAQQYKQACEALDRLVDIDPYDYRNQERISKLEGKVDPAFIKNILARAAKAATVSTRTDGFSGAGSSDGGAGASKQGPTAQVLEDLIVQVEIFLQYSLQSKAIERLERLAQAYPGEEDRNERLRALYERANWWPKGAEPKPAAPLAAAPPARESPVASVPTAEEAHRDLTAIGEINRLMYRQATPREVLAGTAEQVAKHLGVARCLIAAGGASKNTHLIAEHFAPGITSAGPAQIAALTGAVLRGSPDAVGAVPLDPGAIPALADLGVGSALAVILTDKESPSASGMLLVGDTGPRKWKPNEGFFLQAVGDQLVLAMSHTRLRSLVRSLAVADERTGLLSRGAYIDCLLAESNRARIQNTPLSLVVVQIDRGNELVQQHGEPAVQAYVEQVTQALCSAVRQTDVVVKYTAWSLVFILPDTTYENAKSLAEKLRQVASTVQPGWEGHTLAISGVVAQATARSSDDAEDRVTEWINRAEAGIEELRHRGGNAIVEMAAP